MTQSETDKHTTGHAAENLWSFCPRTFTYEFQLPYILGTLVNFSTLGLSKSRLQVPKSPLVVHMFHLNCNLGHYIIL